MLEIRNIQKFFSGFHLKDISFEIEDGDYFVLLGESGAGKSVLLEIIAGLIRPDAGSVYYKGANITDQKIQNRNFGLVFQDYAIFPHLKVKDNIAYPLKRKKTVYDIKQIVSDIAKKLDIDHLLLRKPETLSGGELQRVALARILALEPDILLLDEPLSSLDAKLKDDLSRILRKLNLEGITIIHVTHDYQEAISLAKNVGVIFKGEIIQTGTPKEVFNNPRSKFVAQFTGIKNFFKADFFSDNTILIEGKLKVSVQSKLTTGSGYMYIKSEDVMISRPEITSVNNYQYKAVIVEINPHIKGVEIIADMGIHINILIPESEYEKCEYMARDVVFVGFSKGSVHLFNTE